MLDIFLHVEDVEVKLHQKQFQKHLCCYLSRCKHSVVGLISILIITKAAVKLQTYRTKYSVYYPSSIKDNV